MHASSDIRIVKCLDGLHYSFEILRYVYSSLHEACAKIKDDQEALIPAIWLCWSFVDVLHRIREIAQALPGLSGKDKELVSFLKETNLAEEYRHYIQHLRAELSNPTFAIRAKKRSFLGIQRLETLDFTGVDFQKAL
ncbi:MAG TPA: hypothetical protein VJ440_12970 [Candidatus Brocadiaceae bacterium]|nr:hypothetical protein [Candidatus Brocadiaceae bacterium]